MGGTVVILHDLWKDRLVATKVDDTGLAVMVRLDFSLPALNVDSRALKFSVVGSYVLPQSKVGGEYTMWQRLQGYLAGRGAARISPREYIEAKTSSWVAKAKKVSAIVMLVGDLNGSMEAGKRGSRDIRSWVRGMGLCSPLTTALLPGKDYHTFFRDGVGVSRVDYALHTPLPSGFTVSEIGTHNHCSMVVFDHRPVWLGLSFPVGYVALAPSCLQDVPKRVDLSLDDKKTVGKYQVKMTKICGALFPPGNVVELSSETSSKVLAVLATKSLFVAGKVGKFVLKGRLHAQCRLKRSRFKDGFSPQMRVVQDAMYVVLKIRSGLKRSQRRGRKTGWGADAYLRFVRPLVARWVVRAHEALDLLPGKKGIGSLKLKKGRVSLDPRSLTTMPFRRVSLDSLAYMARSLRGMLHGRERRLLRSRMSKRVAEMQKKLETGKLRDVISALTQGGKRRGHFDWSRIKRPDGTYTSDRVQIAEELGEHAVRQHSAPADLDPVAREIHASDTLWRELSRGDPVEFPSDTNIPSAHLIGLRKICQRKVSLEVSAELERVMALPVTVEDFTGAIKSAARDRAPGPSGLTINMVKGWPPDVLLAVHGLLETMWNEKYVPEWWKDRLMHIIPKKDQEMTFKNMRPIGLLEVLRKLWSGVIVRRIMAVWEKHGALHKSQHGYRWLNGTETALVRLMDAVENAREKGDPLYCVLYDIKAAFDSVDRNLMRLAWTRLGVPDSVVQWLTELDHGGLVFPKTPYMMDNMEPRDPMDIISTHDSHILQRSDIGVSTDRGVVQGGTESTVAWVAVFDMVLSWLMLMVRLRTLRTLMIFSRSRGMWKSFRRKQISCRRSVLSLASGLPLIKLKLFD